MKIKPILAIAALAAALVGSARADTYAFLMGINDYPEPVDSAGQPLKDKDGNVISNDLHGAVNDVNDMKAVLMSKFGVPEANIKVTTDTAATEQGFIDGMKWLISSSKAGDQILFHFSGHGAQLKVDEKEDPSGKEEFIFLGDEKLVPDKLFSTLAKTLAGKGVHVTFAFDSCHSGGLSRDAGDKILKIKGLDRDKLSARAKEIPKATAAALQVKAKGLVTGTGQEKGSYAFLFACKPEQTSSDISYKNNVKPAHGVFTMFLTAALNIKSDVGLETLESVMIDITKEAGYSQVPNFEYSSADRANKPLIWK